MAKITTNLFCIQMLSTCPFFVFFVFVFFFFFIFSENFRDLVIILTKKVRKLYQTFSSPFEH